MRVSARNAFAGTITDIRKGSTTAHVVLDVNGLTVTASITNESVDDLQLKVGGAATAIVKSSDVIIAVE